MISWDILGYLVINWDNGDSPGDNQLDPRHGQKMYTVYVHPSHNGNPYNGYIMAY